MKVDRRLLGRAAIALFYLLVGVFIWRYVARLDLDLLQATTISWPLVLAAWPASLLARAFLVLGWREILRHYQPQVPRLVVLNSIYGTAWLARYVPGKVWYHVGKIRMAGRFGVDKEDSGLSSALEIILQLSTGIAVGLLLILSSGKLDLVDSGSLLFSIVILGAASVLAIPSIFNRVVAVLIRRLRSLSFDRRHFVDSAVLGRLLGIYTAVHLMTGLPVLLLLRSLYPEATPADYPFVTGVVVLSGVLGALALFAPSGLGVREALQLALLSASFPAETVLVFVLLLRMWSVFVDLSYWAVSALWLTHAGRSREVVA